MPTLKRKLVHLSKNCPQPNLENNPKTNFQQENFQEKLLFKKMYLMSSFPSASEKASPCVGGGKVRTWD